MELQAVYLRNTTYLQTPLFGIIPVVTLFVVCVGAVVAMTANITTEKQKRLTQINGRLAV